MLTKKVVATVLILTGLPFALTACNDDDKVFFKEIPSHDTQTEQTANVATNIVAAAQATPDLSILVEAVAAADLVDTLSKTDSPAPYTVFAPTNQAFTNLLSTLGLTKTQLLADKALLTKVLTYHVVPNAQVKKADIPFGKPIQTINGNAISINTDAKILDAKGNLSQITTTDVMTGNGVVHIIDTVILPAEKNLVEVAQANEDFSILVEAVVSAGLADTLATTKNLTVFAPTNDAFAALLTELGMSKADLLANKALLTQVLKYHVVPDLVYSSEVTAGNVTSLEGSTFSFGSDAKITDSRQRQATLTATDIQAKNGVIHVLDKVILPPAGT